MSDFSPVFSVSDAEALININDVNGRFTPNQTNFNDSYWLWDSAFIAAGLAYINPRRSAEELKNLMSSQHENGMVPHTMLRDDLKFAHIKHFLSWGSGDNEQQQKLLTSGITQPPVIATVTKSAAEQLTVPKERSEFLTLMFDGLVKYGLWWLRERDVNNDGVVTIIHPWESGMDNSPSILHGLNPGKIDKFLGQLTNSFRRDVHEGLDSSLRTPVEFGIASAALLYRLRIRNYDSSKILGNEDTSYTINSVLVNSILMKSTKDLEWIGQQIDKHLPPELKEYLSNSKSIINTFWDEKNKRFYDIDAITGEYIKIPTISNILPLINHESLTEEQGNQIIKLILDETEFSSLYGVPTISQNSSAFNPKAYWSGPMWPWMNRYLFHGANEAGEKTIAYKLRQAVLNSVGKHGAFEHYNPLTSEPGGAKHFAPSAGSYIELGSSNVF